MIYKLIRSKCCGITLITFRNEVVNDFGMPIESAGLNLNGLIRNTLSGYDHSQHPQR